MSPIRLMKDSIRKALKAIGYDVVNVKGPFYARLQEEIANAGDAESDWRAPPDYNEEDIGDFLTARPFTMTSPERIFMLTRAIEYIVRNRVPGAIVECGVWKGGSMLNAARVLSRLQDNSRHLYLCDTFAGWTKPTGVDVSIFGENACGVWGNLPPDEAEKTRIPVDAVKAVMKTSGYDERKIHYVIGPVEETIPDRAPEAVSLLRLDTDFYESTLHELIHLFPRLSVGGVLILDDYGHWLGAKKAVDEYFGEHGIHLLLNRVDASCRMGIKNSS